MDSLPKYKMKISTTSGLIKCQLYHNSLYLNLILNILQLVIYFENKNEMKFEKSKGYSTLLLKVTE